MAILVFITNEQSFQIPELASCSTLLLPICNRRNQKKHMVFIELLCWEQISLQHMQYELERNKKRQCQTLNIDAKASTMPMDLN